jgi:hypothetical protein
MAIPNAEISCLFFKDLPDGCICLILQYYSDKLTVKCIAQFSSMTAGLYNAILSESMRLIWPSLPPMCLCESPNCSNKCGRERVPTSYYKNVLTRSRSQSRALNIHFHSVNSIDGTAANIAARRAIALVYDFRESLEELMLHITISSPKETFVATKSEQLVAEDYLDKISFPDTIEDSEIIFPKLSTLLVNIEYICRDDEKYLLNSLTGAMGVAILKLFGAKVRNLSIFTYNLLTNDDVSVSGIEQREVFGTFEEGSNNLSVFCPLLSKLEIFGCDLRIFSDQSPSNIACSRDCFLSTDNVHQLYGGNMIPMNDEKNAQLHQYSPLNLPLFAVLEVEANFKVLEDVNIVFRMIPSSTIVVSLMGSISKFLLEIFLFMSVEKLSNLRNLEVLEIHDSSPWPFCDEISHVDACSVLSVYLACPKLKKIVMSTVHFSDSAICTLSLNSLVVTQQNSTYSTIVSKD